MPQFSRTIPAGDNRERDVCSVCGYVAYENPKVVAGSVVVHDGKVLLCRRAIEPRSGFWTLPAGYLELNETTAEGARREALEEAGADIALDGILALYDVSRISQIQIIYRASLVTPGIAAGIESLEVGLFAWDDIPWNMLAFPTVRWALQAWHDAGPGPLGAPAGNPTEDIRGVRRIEMAL
ncbi:MAG: NUDIX hydrolase [Acetobacteraceae bacterium]